MAKVVQPSSNAEWHLGPELWLEVRPQANHVRQGYWKLETGLFHLIWLCFFFVCVSFDFGAAFVWKKQIS